MKCSFLGSSLATKLAAALVVVSGATASNLLAVDEVGFDDFEGLTLEAFTFETDIEFFGADGTDYSNDTPTGWVIDNNLAALSAEGEWWDGGKVHDFDSYRSHDYQLRGLTGALGVPGSRNSILVFDGDEWDDGGTGGGGTGYNSYWYKTHELTGDTSQTELVFDYETRVEDTQTMVVEVTSDDPTDAGAVWTNLLTIGPEGGQWVRGRLYSGIGETFSVANGDFTVTGTSFTVRLGCITAGNDWWVAFDNVDVSTDTYADLTDFEGLAMLPYGESTPTQTGVIPGPGDGTDWTNVIPGWTIDNSQMQFVRAEAGWQGWNAMDMWSADSAAGQYRAPFFADAADPDPFALVISDDPNNTVMMADGDEWDDNPILSETGFVPDDGKPFNSFVSREYDLTAFNNSTLTMTFDWQHRIESTQRASVAASFDGGATFVDIWVFDSETDAAAFTAFGETTWEGGSDASFWGDVPGDLYMTGGFFDGNGDFIRTPETVVIDATDFGINTFNLAESMILRFGYEDAGNNWWFAFDNVLVEADAQDFVNGDVSGDGAFTNVDVGGIIQALTDPAGFAAAYPDIDPDQVLDFNGDGILTNGDVGGMLEVLTGG